MLLIPSSSFALTVSLNGSFNAGLEGLKLMVVDVECSLPNSKVFVPESPQPPLKIIKENRRDLEIVLNPIKSGEKSKKFSFRYNQFSHLTAGSKRVPTETEYDGIIRLGNSIVVFEVKLGKWRSTGPNDNNGKAKRRGRRGLGNSFRQEVYDKRLAPVIEWAGEEVGYAVMMPRGTYFHAEFEHQKNTKGLYASFKRDHGVGLPFPLSSKAYNKEVLKQILKQKLPLKK